MLRSIFLVLFLFSSLALVAQDRVTVTMEALDGTEVTVPLRNDSEKRTSPNAMVAQTLGITEVQVRYGRPYVKGRDVFGGELVPYDKVWRTGANEATTITFLNDVLVEGKELGAGTYALFTVPKEGSWDIILNSEAAQWGAYKRDASKDVLTVTVDSRSCNFTEMFTILFNNVSDSAGDVVLRWAETEAAFTVEVQE